MMKRLLILPMLLFVCVVYAQPRMLTLEECRQLALENNTNLLLAEQTAIKANQTRLAALANFFPEISATGNYFYSNAETNYTINGGYLPTFSPDLTTGKLSPNIVTIGGQLVYGSDGNPIFSSYAYMPDISLNMKIGNIYCAAVMAKQPIFWGGKIISGYRMASAGTRLSNLNKKLTKDQIILQSDEAYWNCLKAYEMLSVVESYYTTIEEFCRNMENAVNVGFKSSNDLMKVQVTLNEAELNLLKVKNSLRLAKMNLCYISGLPLSSEIEVSDVNINLHDEVSVQSNYDISNRIEYQMLSQKIEMKREAVKVTRSDYLPHLGVQVSYGYLNGIQLNGSTLVDNANFMAVASLSIPIFKWGEGRHSVKASYADLRMAEIEREDAARKMTLEIEQTINQFKEAKLELQIAERSCAQAEENMRVSKNRYEAGTEPISNFLEAQAQWQKSLSDAVNARMDLRLSYTRYLKAIGNL
jgi:outer membrane protein TolC